MVKLRTKEGDRFKVEENISFIEICDLEGNLGCLVHIQNPEDISVLFPGDSSFERYTKVYKSKRSQLLIQQPTAHGGE